MMRKINWRTFSYSILLFALLVNVIICSYYLILKRFNFYDDSFIYLHIARNAVESGTWQYFPIVDRPALLATSPLKIIILTVSAHISDLIGFKSRTLMSAKVTLLISTILSYVIWVPFWKKNVRSYMFIGVLYFILAVSLNTVIEFEGGLLFLWMVTLVVLVNQFEKDNRIPTFVILLGFFIRPDITSPIVLITVLYLIFNYKLKLNEFFSSLLTSFIKISVVWILISFFYKVWPIPITYWAKSTLSNLFESNNMIVFIFQRMGYIITRRFNNTPEFSVFIGLIIIFGFLIVLNNNRILTKSLLYLGLTLYGLIMIKSPANYWWYYENILILLIGYNVGIVLSDNLNLGSVTMEKASNIFYFFLIFFVIIIGSYFEEGPIIWSFNYPSRAQGYTFMADKLSGKGTYYIYGQKFFVKLAEIGIVSYYSGRESWVFDMGGLAQPLNVPSVQNSLLRFFYPPKLRIGAQLDLEKLTELNMQKLPIVTIWALEDRDFDKAKNKCNYVDIEGALCINW